MRLFGLDVTNINYIREEFYRYGAFYFLNAYLLLNKLNVMYFYLFKIKHYFLDR